MRAISGLSLPFALLAACGSNGDNGMTNAGNAGTQPGTAAETPAKTAQQTNADGSEQAAGKATARSILAWSKPAAGSTVSGPVNELLFHFSPPARLGEVTVTGPDGAMPMMVTAVGEVEHYSLPLSGLEAGSYTVDWKASARGVDYRGSFSFQVR